MTRLGIIGRLLRHADAALRVELQDAWTALAVEVLHAGELHREAAATTRALVDAERAWCGSLIEARQERDEARAETQEACDIASQRGLNWSRAIIWAQRWKALAKRLGGEVADAEDEVTRLRLALEGSWRETLDARAETERLSAELRRVDPDCKLRRELRACAACGGRGPTQQGWPCHVAEAP